MKSKIRSNVCKHILTTALHAISHRSIAAAFGTVITTLLGLVFGLVPGFALTGCAMPQGSPQPEWVKAYEDNEDYTFYLHREPSTPNAENPHWKDIALLVDIPESRKTDILSIIFYLTIDCDSQTSRINHYSGFAEHMSNGELVRSEKFGTNRFMPLSPDNTEDQKLLHIICQP